MIRLSIIIPHYNSPRLLNSLLGSIPAHSNIQTLVVDDRSDQYLDEYEEITKKYETAVIFLKNESKNKGAGAARNTGLKLALGDWVLFADADDYFVSGFYHTVSQYFTTDHQMIYFSPTSIDLETDAISDRHIMYEQMIEHYLADKRVDNELMLRYRFYSPCSKLIRRRFIEENEIRFDETIAANDMMFSAKLGFYATAMTAVQETIYCITKSKGSLTQNMSEKVFDARLSVYICYYQFLKSKLEDDLFKRLQLNGRGMIRIAVRRQFGIKKIWQTVRLLRSNKVVIFEMKLLSPRYMIKKLRKR